MIPNNPTISRVIITKIIFSKIAALGISIIPVTIKRREIINNNIFEIFFIFAASKHIKVTIIIAAVFAFDGLSIALG